MLALTVIWPVRVPVPLGVKVTWIVQLEPAATLEFTQLSVSLKSPLIEMAVTVRGMAARVLKVTVCALLAVPNTWLAKLSEVGLAAAVVRLVPRSKAASARCRGHKLPPPALATTRRRRGAQRNHRRRRQSVPKTDQQCDGATAQFATCVVK